MVKALIFIQCDDCDQHFFFARPSNFTTDALNFNVNVLTTMLGRYNWSELEKGKLHVCDSCINEYASMEAQMGI